MDRSDYAIVGVQRIDFLHHNKGDGSNEYISFREVGIATYFLNHHDRERKGLCIKVYIDGIYDADIVQSFENKHQVYIFYMDTRGFRLFSSMRKAMHFIVSDYVDKSLLSQVTDSIGSNCQGFQSNLDNLFRELNIILSETSSASGGNGEKKKLLLEDKKEGRLG